ncbi:MAG: fibronectin type III domain-containing protein [Candidatus Saccharimonadales bacterium]
MQLSNKKIHGFTLVELLVVTPIVLLIISSFVVVLINLTGDALINREQLVQAKDNQSALDRIEQDVRLSNRFLAQNRTIMNSPQGVNDNTTNFTNVGAGNGTALILQTISTDKNPIDTSRNLVFLTNSPNACASPLVTSNSPYYVNIAYFVKNTNLYRRVLMTYNPSPAPCVTPWQQPTCTTGLQNGNTCISEDSILATGVSSLNLDYYTDPSSSTAITDASSTSLTVTQRDSALANANSVKASITLAKTISGRNISYSGSTRVTKLNSSAVEQPNAPVVTGRLSGPAQVTFTWPAISSATSYVISYNINGTGWIDVPGGTSSTSYTINAYRSNTVSIRVAANNPTGTSPSGTSSYLIPDWTACALQNSWVNYGAPHAAAAFTKTSADVVVLKGLVKNGTGNGSEVLCTLPPGYRPSYRLLFEVAVSGGATGRIDIDTAGNIIWVGGSTSWTNLSGLTFIANGDYNFTNLTAYNGWGKWNDSRFAPVQAAKDSLGRVHIQGLPSSGTVTNGTNMFKLPAGSTVAGFDLYNASSSSANSIMLSASGYIVARGQAGAGFTSTQLIYLPTPILGWTAATLGNGWVNYGGGFSAAQYTESADGMVFMKGLIKSGTTTSGTVLFTLPVGKRPKEIIICNMVTYPTTNNYGRVDVYPDGTVVLREGVDPAWISLAGCPFISEQ